MNVFGMGPGELILIFVIALIVFGPNKLTEIGGSLGRGVREFRRATSELTEELSQSAREVRQPIDEVKQIKLDQQPAAIAEPQPVVEAEQTYGANNTLCPQCAAPNPRDNKFCGHCGASLLIEKTPPD